VTAKLRLGRDDRHMTAQKLVPLLGQWGAAAITVRLCLSLSLWIGARV
jgi:hypothetical protein